LNNRPKCGAFPRVRCGSASRVPGQVPAANSLQRAGRQVGWADCAIVSIPYFEAVGAAKLESLEAAHRLLALRVLVPRVVVARHVVARDAVARDALH
jgi:hypothetical protein